MVLTPRMAYQREYFGEGMFFCAASGAIFRTAAFRELGGFEDRGGPSDYFFWLRASTRVNVALLPADLFWYRVHADQEFHSEDAELKYLAVRANAAWRALDAPECPLTAEERVVAKRNRAFHLAKRGLQDVRRGRLRSAWIRFRSSGLGVADWLTYLRLPQRDRMAGTPRTADGDFMMPRWLSHKD